MSGPDDPEDPFDIDFEKLFANVEDFADEARALEINALDSEELGAVYDVSPYGNRMDWIAAYLVNTSEDFKSKGRGDWICRIKLSHNRVDDEDMNRMIAGMRSRLSTLRTETRAANFYFVSVDYEIMPDKQHVIWHVARMTQRVFSEYRKANRGGWQRKEAIIGTSRQNIVALLNKEQKE